MRTGLGTLKAIGCAVAVAWSATATAQTVVTPPPAPAPETVQVTVETETVTTPPVVSREVVESVAPAQPQALDLLKIFVDTTVADVVVDDEVTMAFMSPTVDSPCRSSAYIYGRARPKWLYETGRLIQAMKEQALIRVSFTCINGEQSINALQFLSPPPAVRPRGLISRRDAVILSDTLAPPRSRLAASQIPLPTDRRPTVETLTREQIIETVPMP